MNQTTMNQETPTTTDTRIAHEVASLLIQAIKEVDAVSEIDTLESRARRFANLPEERRNELVATELMRQVFLKHKSVFNSKAMQLPRNVDRAGFEWAVAKGYFKAQLRHPHLYSITPEGAKFLSAKFGGLMGLRIRKGPEEW